MNKDTKELKHRLNKDYLTIDDVKQQGGVGKVYLVVGNDLNTKYWFCKNKYENILIPTNDESYDSEIKHQFLIIGNGFDLHCGMGSSYTNFFNELFGISLGIEVKKLIDPNLNIKKYENKTERDIRQKFKAYYRETHDAVQSYKYAVMEYLTNCKGILLNNEGYDNGRIRIKTIIILKQINEKILKCLYSTSKWDVVFFVAKLFYLKENNVGWSDVEKMIFYVVSLLLNGTYHIKYFNRLIKNIFQNDSKNDLANEMLAELNTFEKEFAIFIQSKETIEYYAKAQKTLEQITLRDNNLFVDQRVVLDVFDFNYSLNYYAAQHFLNLSSKILIHDWTNIHGIADYNKGLNNNLPSPIFGFDLRELLDTVHKDKKISDDIRLKFTKSYRLSTNHVNMIRKRRFQEQVDTITIVGHSLNKADYSYFEFIFDKYNLYDGDVCLEFYYAPQFTKEEDYTKDIDALLTDYGQTLSDTHGENIFNKLMLEQRLKILKYPGLGEEKV